MAAELYRLQSTTATRPPGISIPSPTVGTDSVPVVSMGVQTVENARYACRVIETADIVFVVVGGCRLKRLWSCVLCGAITMKP